MNGVLTNEQEVMNQFKIEHVAIWVSDLELMKDFYQKYFGAASNGKYHNVRTGFESYFLSFGEGPRIEIMKSPEVSNNNRKMKQFGYAHFAISVGNSQNVIDLTEVLRRDGFVIYSEPRTTGDGYFESVILDPDGNLIEITI